MSDPSDRELRERLKRDIAIGQAAAAAALDAAEDIDALVATIRGLSAHEARCGLAFTAVLHARKTRGGVRYTPDDRLAEAALAAADERELSGAWAVSEGAPDAAVRAALGSLAHEYRAQRRDAVAIAMQANLN